MSGRTITATNILKSWLTAAGIEYTPLPNQILDVSGTIVQVTEIVDQILSPNPNIAFEAYWKITDTLNLPRILPVDRGFKDPTKFRLSCKKEPFLVTVRHNEFRRSVNPTKETWQKYEKIIKYSVSNFYRKNYYLSNATGYTQGDIETYVRCYVVNFCSQYSNESVDPAQDLINCQAYIKQRLYNDLKILMFQTFNNFQKEDYFITRYGQSTEPETAGVDEGEPRVDTQYLSNHALLPTRNKKKRRNAAGRMLHELLAQLPHDEYVAKLADVEDRNLDYKTKRLASKILKEHRELCFICNPPLEIHENPTGIDLPSRIEQI